MKEELKSYKLTSLQIHTIETLCYKFERHLEFITELCDGKKENINLGFELGKMYSIIDNDFQDGLALIEAINEQN
jgi:transcription antitermination factor NusG